MIPSLRKQLLRFGIACGVLVLLFLPVLVQLTRYALKEDLFSHVLLIPFVCVWLVWQHKDRWPQQVKPDFLMTGLFLSGAVALVATAWLVFSGSDDQGAAWRLSLFTAAFVVAIYAAVSIFLGGEFFRKHLFALLFLLFFVPIPPAVIYGVETGLQYASAEASDWLFALIGAPFLRDGLFFHLPNITIEVARECSGIRSTLVLFITSLLAGYLFLDRNWQRWVFVLLVIPLGIARNAFRIVTIGWLCIEYGPEMIHSPIHHRGGPVFFALSLIPLFLLLFLFRRFNRKRDKQTEAMKDMDGPVSPVAAR